MLAPCLVTQAPLHNFKTSLSLSDDIHNISHVRIKQCKKRLKYLKQANTQRMSNLAEWAAFGLGGTQAAHGGMPTWIELCIHHIVTHATKIIITCINNNSI